MKNELLMIACTLGLLGGATISAQDRWGDVRWGDQYATTDKTSLFGFPEKNSDYYTYHFRFDSLSQDTAIRISGEFPMCRYSSFAVYQDGNALRDAVTSEYATLVDMDIEPDQGSVNPFQPYVNRNATNRSFSFLLTTAPNEASLFTSNIIALTPENTNVPCSLTFRVYLRDDESVKAVPPVIEYFDLNTGKASRAPRNLLNFPNIFRGRRQSNDDGPPPPIPVDLPNPAPYTQIRGFSSGGNTGLFSEQRYVYLTLNKSRGQVALLKWRLPEFTDVKNPETPFFTGDEEVRYCSVSTYTSATFLIDTLADYELKVDSENIATLVLGPAALREQYEDMGFNFMVWDTSSTRILFRQKGIAPSFFGSFDKLPEYNDDYPAREQYADLYIGDYAPTGEYIDE